MRVLVANEPRSYREALQRTVLAVRPHIEVMLVEPHFLVDAIAHLQPHLVICSQFAAVQHQPFTWIVLYPEGERNVVISMACEQTTLHDLGFDQLLTIVDGTETRLHNPTSPRSRK